MHAQPPPLQHPDRASRARRSGVALATLLALALLAGCGLRTESPPPVERSPDAIEQVRARTVADSLALAEAARALTATPAGVAEPLASVLADIASFCDQHAEQAGGTYVSGLPTPTTSPYTPPAAADVPTLLAQLGAATTTSLTDVDAVPDGALARLVASIATSRSELTARLAQAAGLPAPTPDAATPAPTPDIAAPVPSASPGGPRMSDLDALALAHDQAGFGFEVIAAKLAGDQRTAASAAAASNRAAGERWARDSGRDGTAQDPRRASYALPTGLDDPTVAVALGRTLESAVADAYADAVAGAPVGARLPMVDGLRAATAAAGTWGATPVPFPGLAEQVQKPAG